ncbi:hypothetical protein BDY19DRAFT_207131 [Irpex rosettiformis]|uniref:Uncharacterized protein n=1 Tax=Irpex rosettiformis TaxID=378272 RepID=A0ACB8U134_9APHY|nr:hypothetical protein BDY19DRAFT_207131 [Irpex rosettiformis]
MITPLTRKLRIARYDAHFYARMPRCTPEMCALPLPFRALRRVCACQPPKLQFCATALFIVSNNGTLLESQPDHLANITTALLVYVLGTKACHHPHHIPQANGLRFQRASERARKKKQRRKRRGRRVVNRRRSFPFACGMLCQIGRSRVRGLAHACLISNPC